MEFFTTAINSLSTVFTLTGAGFCMMGMINLLESYGQQDPSSRNQGTKQLMAGAGIVIVAKTLVPMLASMFTI